MPTAMANFNPEWKKTSRTCSLITLSLSYAFKHLEGNGGAKKVVVCQRLRAMIKSTKQPVTVTVGFFTQDGEQKPFFGHRSFFTCSFCPDNRAVSVCVVHVKSTWSVSSLTYFPVVEALLNCTAKHSLPRTIKSRAPIQPSALTRLRMGRYRIPLASSRAHCTHYTPKEGRRARGPQFCGSHLGFTKPSSDWLFCPLHFHYSYCE